MALPEIEASRGLLFEVVAAVVTSTDGLSSDQLNWRPAPESNSLLILATHVIGAVEESVLTSLCRARPSERDRDAEFRAAGDSASQLSERWQALRSEIEAALDGLSRADLEVVYRHPRRGR